MTATTTGMPSGSSSAVGHHLSQRLRVGLIALVIGLVFTGLSLSSGYIAGTGPFWQTPQGDAATAQIGWQYYARDEWRWPVFAVENYHAPEGSTVLLSDSLPLLALPMKAISKVTGSRPNYVGFWVALCLLLQAICASRLLWALEVRDVLGQVGGIVLFCWAPILLTRFGHATLMAQWLILIALERYVVAKRHGLSARGWIALCVLPTIAEHAHPYLAAMTAALVFVTVVDQWREHRLDAKGALLRLGGSAALAIGVALIDGLFRGGGTPYLDYGQFSLNLAAPFTPLGKTLLGSWLRVSPAIIPGTGQYEGACYLGAGMLLLCVLALMRWRFASGAFRRHAVLAMVLLVMTIVAVSNRIGFGAHELLHIALPERLVRVMSVFRAAGRFVWLDVYALLVVVVVAVLRLFGSRRGALLIAVAALLQVIDIAPLQAGWRHGLAGGRPVTIDRAAWSRLIDTHDRLFQFPSFECGGLFGNGVAGDRLRELEIDWLAAQRGKPTNSAYLARSIKGCERERSDALTIGLTPGTLRLYRSTQDIGAYLAQHSVDLDRCGLLNDVVVCAANEDLSALR